MKAVFVKNADIESKKLNLIRYKMSDLCFEHESLIFVNMRGNGLIIYNIYTV